MAELTGNIKRICSGNQTLQQELSGEMYGYCESRLRGVLEEIREYIKSAPSSNNNEAFGMLLLDTARNLERALKTAKSVGRIEDWEI